ncbi:5-hydroxytryptamine receptor 1A [Tachyglossus aculeatus]|uniref:5-hydroxytryptamine receptor 1A n=1 Tax=Tachyglossus aculeatus TaxID=9261 RepID=UPI0018F3B8A1|nr:5-hydroxytryptamine receptor 1A [Tachyglossus aculeatus]
MEAPGPSRAPTSGPPAASPPAAQLATALVLGALIACSAAGNLCVVAAVALERSLHNVASYLIGSLAATDLLVSVLVLPMAALYQVLGRWTLGQAACDLFISLDVLCCTSSILHLCAIALDRYWAITDPVAYVHRRTPRRAAALVGLTWLVGFLISIPPVLGWRTPEDRARPDACSISRHPGYTVYSTFGAFYIPLLLMLVLYGRIFRAARFRIRRTVRKAEAPAGGRRGAGLADTCLDASPPAPCANGALRPGDGGLGGRALLPLPRGGPGPPTAPAPARPAEAKRKAALARERKTVKTLGIIMGTFILCWLPFFIVALVLPFCEPACPMPGSLGALINWLGYSNSLLNPIIYAYFNKDFQNAFKKIIRCKFCRQ